MKIQVLGSGCPTCAKLNEIVIKAMRELGLKNQVEYLTGTEGTNKIIELGLMSSPALVINNRVVMIGFSNDIEKIKKLINNNIEIES